MLTESSSTIGITFPWDGFPKPVTIIGILGTNFAKLPLFTGTVINPEISLFLSSNCSVGINSLVVLVPDSLSVALLLSVTYKLLPHTKLGPPLPGSPI